MQKYKTDKIDQYQELIGDIKEEISKVIIGHKQVINNVLIALLSNGNILLEGVPGLGKTRLVQSLGSVLDLDYSRIQFTPDLMPADIIGTNILMEDSKGGRYFEFRKGPLFAQLILADEINRATPKTQSALLEAMQEKKITVAGTTRELEEPFFVLATQNPLEMEGTYPLPEAQIDRFFFKLKIQYPDFYELKDIVNMTTVSNVPEAGTIIGSQELREMQLMVKDVPAADDVINHAVKIVQASQPDREFAPDTVKQYVRYGSSPRGAQALILAGKARAFMEGRYSVSFSDINQVALPALRHRLLLNFEGEAAEIDIEDIIQNIIDQVSKK